MRRTKQRWRRRKRSENESKSIKKHYILKMYNLVEPPKNRPHNMQLHVATLLRRNKVITSAINRVGSRSKGCGYSDRSLHAERAVVKRLGDISQLRGATLVVVRYNHQGDMQGSQPCHECRVFLEKCIREYGLRKVIYS